ncbi:hypothetical protein PSY31_23070, partial [Shigella flexneri]|nr:hypothetical protein [Shigella flexneri]
DSQISRLDDAYNFSPASNPHEALYKSPVCPAAFPSASKFESTYQSHAPVKDQISVCRLSKKGKP